MSDFENETKKKCGEKYPNYSDVPTLECMFCTERLDCGKEEVD